MTINTKEKIPEALALLAKHDLWSFDIETSGLSRHKDQVIGFGCANTTNLTGFYIITKEWKNGQLVDVLSKEDVLPILKTLETKKLIGWNFLFDATFILHHFGINLIPALHCEVMLMVHTCDENKFSYGLKQISADLFGTEVGQEQLDMKESIKENGGSSKQYFMANSALVAKYGLQDNILTCKNYNYWSPILKSEGLEKFFYNDEVMPLLKEVTFPMQYSGIPVNVKALQEAKDDIELTLEQLEDSIQAEIAPLLPAFENWYLDKEFPVKLSGEFVQQYAKLELIDLPLTKTGSLSLTAKNIESLPECEFKAVMQGRQRISSDKVRYIQRTLLDDSGTKYAFNLLSKDHLKRLFFGTSTTESPLRETPLSKTDKGNPQVDDEFLDVMAKKYSWAQKLRTFNRLTKIKGTYIDRFLDGQENGIFYANFNQHRTVSGRYSGDLQQLPRPIEDSQVQSGEIEASVQRFTNQIRSFFIAAPNHSFADFDYDSQEVKVFAHVSGDQRIKDIFARGDDFYSAVCIEAEGLKDYSANKKAPNYLGKVAKHLRQKAKAYALGLAFNMSPYKLKFELNCSESEAKEIYDNYFKAFPKLKEWLESSKQYALLNGEMTTEAGRKRRYPELRRYYAQYGPKLFDGLELWKAYNDNPVVYAKAKQAAGICKNLLNNSVNHQVQGLAASITNRAAIKCAKALRAKGLKAAICNVIHDQITVHCPDNELEQVCSILQHSMETAYSISVPLTAPPSWGKNFAESK